MNNVYPQIWSLSAVVVGFLLIENLDSNEQNNLGNWLMLVSQLLCTNAVYAGDITNNEPSNDDAIKTLQKMVDALNKEIGEMKKSNT